MPRKRIALLVYCSDEEAEKSEMPQGENEGQSPDL
jgi:hypothetical protein